MFSMLCILRKMLTKSYFVVQISRSAMIALPYILRKLLAKISVACVKICMRNVSMLGWSVCNGHRLYSG